MAARARRLARGSFDRLIMEALTGFACELEARAAALEPAPQTFSHDAANAVLRAGNALRQTNVQDESSAALMELQMSSGDSDPDRRVGFHGDARCRRATLV